MKARNAESPVPVIAAIVAVGLLAATSTAIHQTPAEPARYSLTGGVGREFIETEAEEPVETPTLLNVPLADDLQEYIQRKCEDNGIPYTLVYALIEQESSYKEDIELCARVLTEGKKVFRYNFLAMNAKHRTNAGGCHDAWHSDENSKTVERLAKAYPDILAPHPTKPDEVKVILKDYDKIDLKKRR